MMLILIGVERTFFEGKGFLIKVLVSSALRIEDSKVPSPVLEQFQSGRRI